jgi:two-component system, OmpR family, KDP operon response regulator KdpE
MIDAHEALASVGTSRPALVLAELDMPGIDGIDLCRSMRASGSTSVILLSDDTSIHAEVAALDAGADDFVARPIRVESLAARIRVALRQNGIAAEASVLGVGPFRIDFNERRVRVNGQAVRLTPKEFDLFTFMARHPNRVLPHRALLGAVWGSACQEQSEYLRVFVGQLRKKLESDPSKPRHLLTEPWVGYRFAPDGATPE